MSDMVFVSRGDDDFTQFCSVLEVAVGSAQIVVTELRVRSLSNFATPHEVLGRGGARIALTNQQLLSLVAEYLRFVLTDPVKHEQEQVGYKFSCTKS